MNFIEILVLLALSQFYLWSHQQHCHSFCVNNTQCSTTWYIPSHCIRIKTQDYTHPLEHRVWAWKDGNKWETTDTNTGIAWEQQGYTCECNTIKTQVICCDTKQNTSHFEIHPNENLETVYTGKWCAFMRPSCNFVFVDNITVDTSNHSHICAITLSTLQNVILVIQLLLYPIKLLKSNYTLIRDCSWLPWVWTSCW